MSARIFVPCDSAASVGATQSPRRYRRKRAARRRRGDRAQRLARAVVARAAGRGGHRADASPMAR